MDAATLILVIAAVCIAFWTGSRWRHNRRTWADHRKARTDEKRLRKLRWLTFRAVTLALFVTTIYFCLTGTITLHIGGHDKTVPAEVRSPATPSPSPHKSR